MKLFTRIFFFTVLVITISMTALSFFLISSSFENAKKTEIARAQDEYKMLRASFATGLYSAVTAENATLTVLCRRLERLLPDDCCTMLLDSNNNTAYTSFPDNAPEVPENDRTGAYSFIRKIDGRYVICTMSTFSVNDASYTLIASHSIQSVFDETKKLCDSYVKIYMIMLVASMVLMLILSYMISRPVGKLSAATRKIAGGSYSERVSVEAHDEIGALAESFNTMADEVESHIEALKDEARRREEFTAAFAHELKTPLTSVIGYADMIFTDPAATDDIRKSADFIRNEGMRLEALSHKMMELTVLKKQSFTLLDMDICECMTDLCETLDVVLQRFGAEVSCDTEKAYVRIEPDLFKTLLLNIIDNSLKADAKHVEITGHTEDERYELAVRDDGRGIPEDEQERIKEAFYMVDKMRSRKQHGAGLGLSIAQAIADIHGTDLRIESIVGEGTTVYLSLEKAVTEE